MRVVNDVAIVLHTRRPHLLKDKGITYRIVDENDGMYEVAVKWTLEDAQKLTSLGLKSTPSTIGRDYEWTGKYQPFAHQRETASFLTLHKRAFCFNEQGTGKTASVIWAVDYLMKINLVRRVLVICPLSIMKSAWQQDLFTFAMHRGCSVAHGASQQRRKIIGAGMEFVIINFDGVAVVQDELLAGGFDMIVVDECNAYKNVKTNRWKALQRISAGVDWLWMLTGTPAAQSPVDAFGLAKLVNPDSCPKYFSVFRDTVMRKVSQYVWKPSPDADKIVHRLLQPAIRFEKAQCLDLPPVTHVERDAPLTPQQQKYYQLLKKKMTMQAAGEQVTSVNAATNINKLLQISGGAVYSDDGGVIEFDVSNRLQAILEVIEESTHKVLVFVPFTHTIELLHAFLLRNKVTCDVISGKVSVNNRSDIIQRFQNSPHPHVLIIQPQAASHGLTLTAANTIVWYAPVTSVETYLQANARIDRPGQHNPMTIVHIKGSEVEARLYTLLRSNIASHTKIIDLYNQEISV
jgi:SNF2 family DNA or RNA helicase